jgi:hypothetical protein
MIDRANRLTMGILAALERTVREMRPELEMILRDELDEHRREILREIADCEDRDRD